MNVFKHEFRIYFKSAITWGLALSAITIVFLSIYPAFTKDIEASQKIIESFPPALKDALGISIQNFFTVFGFYTYLFTFISLAGAAQAMNIGVAVISKENSNKTADFLLSKPITRSRVLLSKILAAFLVLVITNVIFITVALTMAKIVVPENFSTKIFIMVSLILFLIQIIFLVLGNLCAVIIPKIKSVIAVSLPVVFAFFIVNMVGSVLGNETVRYITPFKFFDPMYVVNNGSYESKFLLIELVIVVLALISSFVIYTRKDIHAVS